jgi:GT2 family glycosyltransferase
MELSIIIVNYNVRDYLEQCLFSVKKACEKLSCEIIVVDNSSTDGSCLMVKQSFPEVNLIRNDRNKGFAAANNQAIRIAKGRFVLLLNPDTIVEEDAFRKCLVFMKEHPEAGSVGVKMINGKGKYLHESKRSLPTPKIAFYKIFGVSSIFPRSKRFNQYYMGHLDRNETNPVEILTGAFMFIRKEALDMVGLLDESFFMYGEDIDLSYRLIKSGFKNYYYPGVTIIHYKGQSSKKGKINNIIHFYRAMLIFLMKHYSGNGQKIYLVLIKIAIWFRASLSLLRRYILLSAGFEGMTDLFKKPRRTVITCNEAESAYLKSQVTNLNSYYKIIGRVSISPEDIGNDSLGHISQLKEIVKINRISSIIFSTRELNASEIINSMMQLSNENVEIIIAPMNRTYFCPNIAQEQCY